MSTSPVREPPVLDGGPTPSGLEQVELRRQARAACDRILDHAVEQHFAGFDPYDGLAARLPGTGFLKRSRLGRLALIQAVRRSPVNLRPLLRIPPLVNPKTFGLLMSACCDLHRATGDPRYRRLYDGMAARVLELASPGWSGVCWGYPFDWQARAFYLPAGTPTVVCTAFVARGLLDGHETFGHRDGLEMAWSACRFILHDLARSPGRRGFAFSYSPLDRSVVHNASALGAAHVARVASLTGDQQLLPPARAAFEHLLDHQRPDGSWVYGLARHHQWVDTMHTAYVLECLSTAGTSEWSVPVEPARRAGLGFFKEKLVGEDLLPCERAGRGRRFVEAHTLAACIVSCVHHGLHSQARRLTSAALKGATASPHGGLFPDAWQGLQPIRSVPDGFLRWTQAWMCRAMASMMIPRP